MGLFDKLFRRPVPPGRDGGAFQTLTAYTPTFTTWGGQLYENELVRAAIDARARHISKLTVQTRGTARPRLQTRLRKAPNEWQTWGQFLYRVSTILDMQNNAFIVPILDEYGEATGVFPVLPSNCELVQYGGEPYIRYTFSSGRKAALPLKEVGIMTRHQYKDDFFGEKNTALSGTMGLINMQEQGIQEAVKNSNTFRFMARLANFTKPEDLAKERLRFNRENFEHEGGGLLLFPSTYADIKQIEAKSYTVDAEQMKLIQTNVYNYFAVNEDVLQSKAFGDAWSAFFDSVISVFAVQFSDVLTRMLFTERERVTGSGIDLSANRMQYMSNADKLRLSNQMMDRGVITRNEVRAMFNMPPLPPEIGDTLPVRGEYYNLGQDASKNITTGGKNESEANENEPEPGIPDNGDEPAEKQ